MEILLLRIADRRLPVFYAEIPVTYGRGSPDPTLRSTDRNWAERQLRKLQSAVRHAERTAGPRTRRFWAWMNRRRPPDEALLAVLRHADRIEVVHPANLSPEAARQRWRRYLRHRWSNHLATLAWDLLISPLILALMVVPGPNLIGYWFAYRILMHILAMRGVARAWWAWVPTTFRPDPILDPPIPADGHGPAVQSLVQTFGFRHLPRFLRRLARLPEPPEQPGDPVPV